MLGKTTSAGWIIGGSLLGFGGSGLKVRGLELRKEDEKNILTAESNFEAFAASLLHVMSYEFVEESIYVLTQLRAHLVPASLAGPSRNSCAPDHYSALVCERYPSSRQCVSS